MPFGWSSVGGAGISLGETDPCGVWGELIP